MHSLGNDSRDHILQCSRPINRLDPLNGFYTVDEHDRIQAKFKEKSKQIHKSFGCDFYIAYNSCILLSKKTRSL